MMESRPPHLPPQPPGAVNALVNGFNVVANNVGVILFPVLFDTLLWLGPRLKVATLFEPMIQDVMRMQATVKDFPVTPQMLSDFWNGFNLFSVLRTFPLGIFSLMSANLSEISPLGTRLDWNVSGFLLALFLLLLLTLLGWLGGSFYYYAVSRAALKPEKGANLLFAVFNSLLLSGTWALVGLIVSLPAVFVLGLLLLINQTMAWIVNLLVVLFIVWMALPVFFSLHGIFIRTQNAFISIWQSFRMVRYGLPSLGWFAMLAIIISQGLDMLWRIPPTDSWMALVGILGHAFVSTSLLAASFIYYRDMQTWVEAALQWIKTNQITSARA
jgi:hypothetical protein